MVFWGLMNDYSYNPFDVPWHDTAVSTAFEYHAKGMIDETEGTHPKYFAKKSAGGLLTVFDPEAADVIVKMPDTRYAISKGISANEHYFTWLAHHSGIETAPALLLSADDDFILITEKFNHDADIVHVADLIGSPDYFKISFKEVVAAMDRFENAQELKLAFSKQVFFNALIGNLDTHGYNFALLRSRDDGACRVSPMYDIVHTHNLIASRFENPRSIMAINGRHRDIELNDLLTDLALSAENETELVETFACIVSSVKAHITQIEQSFIAPPAAADMKKYVERQILFFECDIAEYRYNNLKNIISDDADNMDKEKRLSEINRLCCCDTHSDRQIK